MSDTELIFEYIKKCNDVFSSFEPDNYEDDKTLDIWRKGHEMIELIYLLQDRMRKDQGMYEENITKHELEIENLKASLEQNKREFQQAFEVFQEEKVKNAQLQDKLIELEQQLVDTEYQLEQVSQNVQQPMQKQMVRHLTQNNEDLNQKILQLELQVDELQLEIKRSRNENFKLKQEVNSINQQQALHLETIDGMLKNFEKKKIILDLQQQLMQAKAENQSLRSSQKRLYQEIQSQADISVVQPSKTWTPTREGEEIVNEDKEKTLFQRLKSEYLRTESVQNAGFQQRNQSQYSQAFFVEEPQTLKSYVGSRQPTYAENFLRDSQFFPFNESCVDVPSSSVQNRFNLTDRTERRNSVLMTTEVQRQNPYYDFFQLVNNNLTLIQQLCQSAKLNCRKDPTLLSVNTNHLFNQFIIQKKPFNQWYKEIEQFLQSQSIVYRASINSKTSLVKGKINSVSASSLQKHK